MELHNQEPGAFAEQDSAELQDSGASSPSSSRGGAQVLVADANGVVVLPAGTELGDIRVEGRDLVVVGADGVRYVIPEGAIIVPQLVIDDVAIPPLNLAALLVGNEPQPAAGAAQSSGGNFASAVGPIQDAYGLGDLLPYTELAFPEPQEEEVIPQQPDRDPTIVIITADQPAGVQAATASVAEAGLAARTGEPAGSNAAANTETTTGTIVFTSPDGVEAITINGTPFTGVGQTISSPRGTLQITSFDPVAGTIGFSYTLTDNLVGATLADEFVFSVSDPDGDVASATLTVNAIDDAPTARPDTDAVAAGSYAAQAGNVITAAGTTSGTTGADTLGADNASITRIASNNVTANIDTSFDASGNLQVAGQYGTLLIKADGSYSYTRAAGTPGGVTDVFTYTLTDADGSASVATLTIDIGDATPVITSVPPANDFDAGTLVFEAGLPVRTGEAPGTNAPAPTETTSGTVTFSGGDGPVTATINGVAVAPGATVTIPDVGTLIVDSFNPMTGVVTYSFTLADNTSGDDTSVTFNVVITDVDGDTAPGTFTIAIRDDTPTAVDDSATQAAENAAVSVDLLGNDIQGADSVQPSAVAVVAGTLSGTGTLVNNGDGTVTYTPGPGESETVTFDYTITDGDGDVDQATATITLLADSTPTIAVAGDDSVEEAALDARPGEPAGSNSASTDNTAAGTIAITTGGDTIGSVVINGVDVTNGGTVSTAKGDLVVTVQNGAYSYSYTLTDNTLSDPDSDTFSLVVTDSDGDSVGTTLVIAIVDDAPAAADDAGTLAAGAYGPISGSVTANDTPGADGIVVLEYAGVTSGTAGTSIDGQYGTLTITAGGTYSYTRNPGTPGGVTDTFTYTVQDGDGDQATANLVITIGDSTTSLDLPVAGTPDVTLVFEEGLAAGSNAASDGEFASGSFTFTAPDGPAIVSIDGTPVTFVGQTFAGSFGTLTITSMTAGSIGYTYELTVNTSGDTTFDDFAIEIADQDDDSTAGTLRIDIVDDVPTANPDFDSVTEDGPLTATGNVISGVDVAVGADANAEDGVADVQGADGATVTAIEFNPAGGGSVAGTVGGTTSGAYGTLTLNADGSYSYELDNANALVQGLDSNDSLTETFTYTLTDGDTDPRTTTLTITINGSDDGITITGLNPAGADEIVDEANLSDGMAPDDPALTQTGSFDVSAQDGIATVSVGGQIVFTGGAFVSGQSISTGYGTLTITSVVPVFDAAGDAVSATVSYSYTLGDNTLTHTGADDLQLTDSFPVSVTDTDGTVATDAVEVIVVDDTPDAIDDTTTQPAAQEGQPVSIDVFTNDVGGADGKVVGTVALVAGSLKLDGGPAGGSLQNNGDGTFTYTPAAGESGTITFDYTVADGDGDTDTATATIVLAGDSTPMFQNADAVEVDEDGLMGANVDASPTLQTSPQETDGTESASGSGTAEFQFGNDVPSVLAGSAVLVDTAALDGQLETLGGADVVFALDGADLVGYAGSTAGAEVIRIALTTATLTATPGEVAYGYTVTLSQPVKHTAAGTEDTDLLSGVTIEVTDDDGDKTTGIFDVTVRDDVPSASDEAGGSLAEGATTTGTLDYVAGADGARVTAINGTTLVFDPVTGFSQGVTLFDAGGTIAVGTIMVTADGSYSFTANDPLNNPVGAIGAFTVTDGDGDTALADIAFTVTDANAPTGGTASAAVDDDGLGTGNPASTINDLNTNIGDAEAVASEATFTGTLTFTDGGDAPATITFAATLDGSFATVGTERVQYSVVGDIVTATVTAYAGDGVTPQARVGTALFSVEILDANAGTYKVTLLANVLHAVGPNEENPVGTDATASIGFTVTDSDGSTAPTTLNVTFDDDAPSVTSNAVTATQATENAAFTFTLVAGVHYAAGADGVDLADVTFTQPAQGTLTYDGAGTFTYTPDAGAGSTSTMDSFDFTVVDGDGDTATKTVNVTLQPDSTPQVVDVVAAVDDDALGGNAGADAATDIDANTGDLDGPGSSEATFSGQLTVDFGADGGTVSFANLEGDVVMLGTETITLAWNGTTLTGSSAGRGDVFTVSLSPSGAYTVTLLKPVLHAPGGQEASTTLDLNYRAVDSDDADTVETGKLTITFNDDVPSAIDDMVTQAAGQEDQPVSIDVFTNDVGGADGKVVGTVALVSNSLKLDGGPAGGSLQNNGDGTFTYTPAAGESGTVTFDYTVADGDGDTDTATATIVLAADSTPMFQGADAVEVDEDGLVGANVDASPLQGAPQETDGTENRIGTGTAEFRFGNDVPAVLAGSAKLVDTAALDGQLVTLSGQNVVFALDGADLVGYAGSTAGAEVIRIALTTATATAVPGEISYGYTVTLSQPVRHATAGSEDTDLLSGVTIEVTDKDNDKTTGTFDVTVRDDVPTAVGDTDSLLAGATGPATGNVLTDTSLGDQGDGDNGADTLGADGGAVTAITGFNGAGTVGGSTIGEYGTLTISADGSYSYTRTGTGPINDTDTFTYTVTDGDGDTMTATLIITLQDNGVTVGANATVLLDDDALNGIAGGVGDDPDAAFLNGTLSGSGGDGTLTFAFATTGAPLGFSYVANGTGIDVFQGGTKVLTVTLNAASGAYTVVQNAPIKHADGANENNQPFTLTYSVSDSDGDSAGGTLAINVDDDTPNTVVTQNAVVNNAAGGPATFNLDSDVNIDNNFGADRPGTIKFPTSLEGASGLTSIGQPVTYHVSADGKTLIATTSATDPFLNLADTSKWVFKVDLKPDGALATANDKYDVTVYAPVDSINDVDFTDGSYNFVGGNTHWVGYTQPSVPNSSDLLVTPTNNGGSANGTANQIGAGGGGGGQSVGAGEGLRLDFVTDLVGSPSSGPGYTPPSNHTYSGHYAVPSASIKFSAGNAGNTATIKFVAYNDDDFTAGAGDTGQVGETVTPVDNIVKLVITYADGAVFEVDTSTVGTDSVVHATGTYTVTKAADGTVTFNGVKTGTSVAVFTADGSYTTLETIHAGGDAFDIIGIGTAVITNRPVSLALPLELSDADNDLVSSYLDLTFKPTAGTLAMTTPGAGAATLANPHVIGTDGDDQITGTSAANTLVGGRGADTLTGGAGRDVFVIDPSHLTTANDDTITDYETGTTGDTVDLRAVLDALEFVAPNNAADATATIRLFGNALQVDTTGTGAGTNWVTVALLSNNPTSVTVLYEHGVTPITLPRITPPVVLDLDGDGVEFVDSSAGAVLDGSATAWAGSDDGILAIDANGNGKVDSGSEIVFGKDGLTDLEALAVRYGEKLDASDADFTKFGVWRDANGDGVSDAGEFVSLADAGITSISLVSDGKAYTAANGEVEVFGSSTYTKADGTTGSLADAAFATEARTAQRTAEIVTTAALAGAMAFPMAAAAQPAFDDVSHLRVSPDFASNRFIAKEFAGSELDTEARSFELLGERLQRIEDAVGEAAHFRGETAEARLVSGEDWGDQSSPAVSSLSDAGPVAHGGGIGASLFGAMGSDGMMQALLSVAPQDVANAELPDAVAALVGDAMSDFAGEAFVNAIVGRFSPGDWTPVEAPANDGADPFMLAQELGGNAVFLGLATLPDAGDDANLLAAAQA